MTVQRSTPIRKFILALVISLVMIPVSRYISPTAFYDGHSVYLAWLPLSVMIALMMLFGRHAVLPLALGFIATNYWQLHLSPFDSLILLFCQLTAVCISSLILYSILGRRWRHGLAIHHIGLRIFWFGFATPILAKVMMYLVGEVTIVPAVMFKEGANKQVISSQADSLIKISRIWADFFPANTSNQPI